jgi:hypothetical protein
MLAQQMANDDGNKSSAMSRETVAQRPKPNFILGTPELEASGTGNTNFSYYGTY